MNVRNLYDDTNDVWYINRKLSSIEAKFFIWIICYHIEKCATAQKMKFFIKNFFCKCDQIHRKLRTWSQLLKEPLMENFIFFAVYDTKDAHNHKQWRILHNKLSAIFLSHQLIK